MPGDHFEPVGGLLHEALCRNSLAGRCIELTMCQSQQLKGKGRFIRLLGKMKARLHILGEAGHVSQTATVQGLQMDVEVVQCRT